MSTTHPSPGGTAPPAPGLGRASALDSAPAGAPAGAAAGAAADAAVHLEDVAFGYGRGPVVLDVARLHVPRAARVFLHGPSGSGKTTLLGVVAGVLVPQRGRVRVLGHELTAMGGPARDAVRAAHVGYVFQLFNLIPYLTVAENIALPCRLSVERRARLGAVPLADAVHAIADALGIAELLARPVPELSVGQQQRVAAARALLGHPGLVVADEPTSALDADRRDRFLDLLFHACARADAALLFVSHDRALAARFDASLSLPELNAATRR